MTDLFGSLTRKCVMCAGMMTYQQCYETGKKSNRYFCTCCRYAEL